MADLSFKERIQLEKLLGMEAGYVLDFSNRTFAEFILEKSGVNIYDEKYALDSGSKANRLRAFWKKEPDHLVGKLLSELLDYWAARRDLNQQPVTVQERDLHASCSAIASRLREGSTIDHIDAIQSLPEDRSFQVLKKSIIQSLQNDEPEAALDRLHTFVAKYVHHLCDKHGIAYDRNKALHALLGQYVKYLKQEGLFETEMTERILRASVSLLEAFNDVRNNRSLAHDNPILNHAEGMLIFSNVASAVEFLQALEGEDTREPRSSPPAEVIPDWDDIPF